MITKYFRQQNLLLILKINNLFLNNESYFLQRKILLHMLKNTCFLYFLQAFKRKKIFLQVSVFTYYCLSIFFKWFIQILYEVFKTFYSLVILKV